MKLIVGLGNIGLNYQNTRHNLGFMAVDKFASEHNLEFREEKRLKCFLTTIGSGDDKTIIIKPTTYMNLSGEAVRLVMNYYKISILDILVICDDLDSEVGRVRLRENGSSGGHNGLKNIIFNLNSQLFKRVKIGIGRDKNIPVVDYVLGKFSDTDKELVDKAIAKTKLIIDDFIEDIPFNKISSKYNKSE